MKSLMGLTLGIFASLRYVPVCSKVFDSQQAVCLLLILCMKEEPSITQSQALHWTLSSCCIKL